MTVEASTPKKSSAAKKPGKAAAASGSEATVESPAAPVSGASPKAKKPPKVAKGAGPGGAAPASVEAEGADAFSDAPPKKVSTRSKKHLVAPPDAASPLLPTFLETFPLSDLSSIEGKGVRGTPFILDGGALHGLVLNARRVVDGEKRGFELQLQLSRAEIDGVVKAVEGAGGKRTSLAFRSTKVGGDGIVRYGSGTGNVSSSSGSNMAPDHSKTPTSWVIQLKRDDGASIDLVDKTAAKATRGFARIHLRGTDPECTAQLQALVAALGMGALFEPPTLESKARYKLMRLLWQADQATAEKLTLAGLTTLPPDSVLAELKAEGYDAERLAQVRWEEVFPGYFTAVDPRQAEELQAAGAAYLFSTVAQPEHLLSILQEGQKASFTRYREGLIVDGMSTSADFLSGGAVGVFTRLVTKKAISQANGHWGGRTYKVILKPEILGRTDYYGWNTDKFGRSWDLTTAENFGVGLVKRIVEPSYWPSSNELIFRTGNGPQWIACVVATDQFSRDSLVKYLEDKGYVPPDGISVEDFVVLAPTFMSYPPPSIVPKEPAPVDAPDEGGP